MPNTTAVHHGCLPWPENAPPCLDLEALGAAAEDPAQLLPALKDALIRANEALAGAFWDGTPVDVLVRARAWVVEQVLLAAWGRLFQGSENLTLVAVGGFGRGELHPHSDVDLMVLLGGLEDSGPDIASIERFVTLLWDAGLHLGHSVRTVEECVEEAEKDVVTATNLMEARCLVGDEALFEAMLEQTSSSRIWPGPEFFEAKHREQLQRHERFEDTAYNLEPNIKESPGGLRDLQTITWVARRHFGAATLHGLVDHGFLSETEFRELRAARLFLWRVRYALHLLAGRAEDRLLFDFQRQIAERLGYGDEGNASESIEGFMQDYYRVVQQLERLNELLLQLFQEELLPDDTHDGERIAEGFQVTHGFLEVIDDGLFRRRPLALLEVFLLLAQRGDIHGLRAATVRLICDHLFLIDEDYRRNPEAMACFFELLRQPSGVYTQLQRMNRYGVLAALIPAFAQITGRMQFDLFHVYTVDQHILFVVRNLRRFAYGKYARDFPRAHDVFLSVDHPELLYLAALFHDIAKGRGGDHSELGATDAAEFCARLPMAERHRNRVVWLVEQHLLMSQTAQRKDINDPEVVHDFAMDMGNVTRLNYLYLLTIADIAATSPKLWNSWKDGLIWELYTATRKALEAGKEAPVDLQSHAREQRESTREELVAKGFGPEMVNALIDVLPANAFVRFSRGQMSWAAAQVFGMQRSAKALVAVRERPDRLVSEVFVSAPDYVGLIATTTTVFDEMGLNVLAARIVTTDDGRSFDLFQVMDANDGPLNENDARKLRQRLESQLAGQTVPRPVRRKLPRRLRPFTSAPEIRFSTARGGTVSSVQVHCSDRPGLLSQLAAAMVDCGIRIHDAMIATFGDRVEDTFLVSDRHDRLLDEDLQAELAAAINRHLSAD
jgi:[protein-PII] uridylyltransferase